MGCIVSSTQTPVNNSTKVDFKSTYGYSETFLNHPIFQNSDLGIPVEKCEFVCPPFSKRVKYDPDCTVFGWLHKSDIPKKSSSKKLRKNKEDSESEAKKMLKIKSKHKSKSEDETNKQKKRSSKSTVQQSSNQNTEETNKLKTVVEENFKMEDHLREIPNIEIKQSSENVKENNFIATVPPIQIKTVTTELNNRLNNETKEYLEIAKESHTGSINPSFHLHIEKISPAANRLNTESKQTPKTEKEISAGKIKKKSLLLNLRRRSSLCSTPFNKTLSTIEEEENVVKPTATQLKALASTQQNVNILQGGQEIIVKKVVFDIKYRKSNTSTVGNPREKDNTANNPTQPTHMNATTKTDYGDNTEVPTKASNKATSAKSRFFLKMSLEKAILIENIFREIHKSNIQLNRKISETTLDLAKQRTFSTQKPMSSSALLKHYSPALLAKLPQRETEIMKIMTEPRKDYYYL